MEKCGKDWRRKLATSAPLGEQEGIYVIPATGAAGEMRACSACAGDYEDPDRTAWAPEDAEEEERGGAASVGAEEFPAEE